jgi:GT2 family glycosyltransferase
VKPIFATVASFQKLFTIQQTVISLLNTGALQYMHLNIVDDCSSDSNVKVWLKELKHKYPEISVYILNEWLPGVSKVLNFGLCRRDSSEQYFVGMDNDGIVTNSNTYIKMLDLFNNNPEVGMVAVRPPIIDHNKEQFSRHPCLPLQLTTSLPNLFTMIRPEALEEVGYYADDYSWTCFDYDMAARVYKIGYETGYYDSSHTTLNGDYINFMDLGREQYFTPEVEVDTSCASINYKDNNMEEFLKNATKQSMELYDKRIVDILYEGKVYEDTSMKEFSNYVEL